MPFMSEAVTYAIWRNLAYRQTGIDDLESVVWVMLWFFSHYIPRGVGEGWSPVKYLDDVASHPSTRSEPATPRTKLSAAMLSPSPAVESTSRKRSFVDSGNPRKRPRQNLPDDPLKPFFSSYGDARYMKYTLKNSGSLVKPWGWDSGAVKALFVEIWSLDGWEKLLPHLELDFNPRAKRLPETIEEEERMSHFSNLVQELKRIFQDAAQHATEYYAVN
jgi:hypothetical protein